MRMICLLALALSSAACAAAQTDGNPASSPLVETRTSHDSRTQTPSLKSLNLQAKKSETTVVVPAVVQITKLAALPEDQTCLTMRVYQHGASNPKTLTSYTECQKVGRHGVKNADLVMSR